MQQPKNLNRLWRALSRQGLEVSYDNKVYSICLNSSLKEHWQDADAPTAEVLLPEDFPVEAKALKQLANLANVRHPQGAGLFHSRVRSAKVKAIALSDKIFSDRSKKHIC